MCKITGLFIQWPPTSALNRTAIGISSLVVAVTQHLRNFLSPLRRIAVTKIAQFSSLLWCSPLRAHYLRYHIQVCFVLRIFFCNTNIPYSRASDVGGPITCQNHLSQNTIQYQPTARNININRNNPITSSYDRIAVMVIASPIRTTAHANDPSWLRHLIVHLAQCRSHLVGQSPSYDHDI